MSQTRDFESLIHRYLLGQLSEPEQTALEQEFFVDPEKFEQVWAAETDLVDDYVQDRLSQKDREQFERYYLTTPQHQERVACARMLAQAANPAIDVAKDATSERPSTALSWWATWRMLLQSPLTGLKYAPAAAGLVLVLTAAWLIIQTTGRRQELARLETELQSARQAYGQMQEQLAKDKAKIGELDKAVQKDRTEIASLNQELTRPPSILDLRLTAERGFPDAPTKLTIPPGNHWIYLEISLGGDAEYKHYRVEVHASGGAVVYRQEELSAVKTSSGNKAITLTLQARQFAPGEYKVLLIGMRDGRSEPVGEYRFRVTAK